MAYIEWDELGVDADGEVVLPPRSRNDKLAFDLDHGMRVRLDILDHLVIR